jgi:hypothetical protein
LSKTDLGFAEAVDSDGRGAAEAADSLSVGLDTLTKSGGNGASEASAAFGADEEDLGLGMKSGGRGAASALDAADEEDDSPTAKLDLLVVSGGSGASFSSTLTSGSSASGLLVLANSDFWPKIPV